MSTDQVPSQVSPEAQSAPDPAQTPKPGPSSEIPNWDLLAPGLTAGATPHVSTVTADRR